MKISKRTREQAAIACAIMACDRALPEIDQVGYFEVSIPLTDRELDLAVAAHTAAAPHWGIGREPDYSAEYAEAEAMLRCGWIP